MKKIIFIILSFLVLISGSKVYAVSPTPTSTVTQSSPTAPANIIQEIDKLKDRIASKVAQLNLVEKRGIIATVTDIGETQLTLSDAIGNIRFVDVDELTKFSSPSAKSNFGISDITKGSTLGVLGLYNKDSRRILARFVDVLTFPQVISGEVMNIDSDNYTITVVTQDKRQIQADIEDLTRTTAFTKADGTVRSGFSKIKQGERVVVVGFPDKSNKDKIVASRIIRLPELKPNPRIPLIKPQETSGVTPSTGSGLKVVPMIKTAK